MTIDERYGYPTVAEAEAFDPDDFPPGRKDELLEVLKYQPRVWRDVDLTAFRRERVLYLRVTLDVGDRPLHLVLQADSDVVQYDAPVLVDFPQAASHFVLSKLAHDNPYLSFRVDKERLDVGGESNAEGTPGRQAREVLVGWGRLEFERFIDLFGGLVPHLVAKLTEAERQLRAFRDAPPPSFGLAA